MAATLASAVGAYDTKNASGERLLDIEFVNAVLVFAVASCVVGPQFCRNDGEIDFRRQTPEACDF